MRKRQRKVGRIIFSAVSRWYYVVDIDLIQIEVDRQLRDKALAILLVPELFFELFSIVFRKPT
jgi:hypothetical protein